MGECEPVFDGLECCHYEECGLAGTFADYAGRVERGWIERTCEGGPGAGIVDDVEYCGQSGDR